MQRRTLLFLLLLLPALAHADAASERAAEREAGKWLALVDAGWYPESWQRAATLFRTQVSKKSWIRSVTAARKPLGAMQSRKLISASYHTSLPGAPDGEYVVLKYETRFRNKRQAIETVTPMLDEGQWRVSGYYVR